MSKNQLDTEIVTANILGSPYNVILFNDDHHSFEEVILQVVKAVKCSMTKALAIVMEAHSAGQAVAFTGGLERCEHVDSILAGPPCSLSTDIQPA